MDEYINFYLHPKTIFALCQETKFPQSHKIFKLFYPPDSCVEIKITMVQFTQ
jgi:hypothetical protein